MKTFADIVSVVSMIAIPALVLFIVIYGAVKRVRIYEAFVEGEAEVAGMVYEMTGVW